MGPFSRLPVASQRSRPIKSRDDQGRRRSRILVTATLDGRAGEGANKKKDGHVNIASWEITHCHYYLVSGMEPLRPLVCF